MLIEFRDFEADMDLHVADSCHVGISLDRIF
jgi:hypothetical protein